MPSLKMMPSVDGDVQIRRKADISEWLLAADIEVLKHKGVSKLEEGPHVRNPRTPSTTGNANQQLSSVVRRPPCHCSIKISRKRHQAIRPGRPQVECFVVARFQPCDNKHQRSTLHTTDITDNGHQVNYRPHSTANYRSNYRSNYSGNSSPTGTAI